MQTVNTSTLPQEQVTTQAIILTGVKWQTFKASGLRERELGSKVWLMCDTPHKPSRITVFIH
ncbi:MULTISPECIES: hypothetical protein [Cyanophyceae]|uniref:hypothetical protein n=1 Tax=Cyanophyceae TaxID=3028117 RepID=UPI001685AFF7|nr:hypothetical protein [Trichocoleus sp. FACHB-40]MBD2002958.1 hypothetical protein [Trichocoleus sp. FACHB-40]